MTSSFATPPVCDEMLTLPDILKELCLHNYLPCWIAATSRPSFKLVHKSCHHNCRKDGPLVEEGGKFLAWTNKSRYTTTFFFNTPSQLPPQILVSTFLSDVVDPGLQLETEWVSPDEAKRTRDHGGEMEDALLRHLGKHLVFICEEIYDERASFIEFQVLL